MSEAATPIDWRTLSEQTGYRVLTFPDGSTLNSAAIREVIPRPAEYDKVLGKHWGQRLTIVKVDGSCTDVYEDVDAVFEMATAAHRQWGGRGPEHTGSVEIDGAVVAAEWGRWDKIRNGLGKRRGE